MLEHNNNIWLSILIPTYNFPVGTNRIYNFIHDNYISGIEVLVFDDSNNRDVFNLTRNHPISKEKWFKYKKNRSSEGPVRNWNSLLLSSKGQYIWLLHHDELPHSDDFLAKIKSIAIQKESHSSPDIIFLRNYIQLNNCSLFLSHIPISAKEFVVKIIPKYLFLHNLIGPPSSLIVRKESFVLFDELLNWFVDLSWYSHLINRSKILFFSDLVLLSFRDNKNSISNIMLSKISKIKMSESLYLLNDFEVLKIIRKKAFFYKSIYVLDFILWKIFYSFIFFTSLFHPIIYKKK
jgi:hypothetical protein